MPGGLHSALDPHSAEASALAELAWVMFGGAAAILALVVALAVLALARSPRWLAHERAVVVGGIAFPAVVLIGLLAYTVHRIERPLARDAASVRIEVTGHQWWWRVRYLAAEGTVDFETANEIRIPVGADVDVALVSADVLHSFWVPSLAGKLDLVPGRVNRMRLAADRPGVYRGQCAEFCGGPHGLMGLHVVALAPDAFDRWRAAQREPAAAGLHPLFAANCTVCHAVRGTPARGARGPDLTHVASRTHIAAGTLANGTDSLATWIASSQHVKPGNGMPSFAHLDATEVAELARFLGGLR